MDQFLALYQTNPLFAGVETAELLPLLQCLQAQKRVYPRGGLISSPAA